MMAELGEYWQRECLGTDARTGRLHYCQKISMVPVAYRDSASGYLQHIDSCFRRGDQLGFPYMVDAAALRVHVAADGTRRIYPGPDRGQWIEIGAPHVKVAGGLSKIQFGQPQQHDNDLAWFSDRMVMNVLHANHYVKAGYELLGGYQPPNGELWLPFKIAGFVRHGLDFYAGGRRVCWLQPLYVYDLANMDDRRPIPIHFTDDYLLLSLPRLGGMARPYVDPVLNSKPVEAVAIDTYVRDSFPGTTFETSPVINAAAPTRNGLILWDVSSIPLGSTINSADMSLWTASTAVTTNNAHAILVANNGWIEACNWNFADGLGVSDRWAGDVGNDGGVDAGCSVSGTDYNAAVMGSWTMGGVNNTEINSALTAATVAAWLIANYGMVLRGTNATLGAWHSSSSATPAYYPELTVDYTEPATGGHKSISGLLGANLVHSN